MFLKIVKVVDEPTEESNCDSVSNEQVFLLGF